MLRLVEKPGVSVGELRERLQNTDPSELRPIGVDPKARTLLHILCRNPTSCADVVSVLAAASPGSLVVADADGRTPVDELIASGTLTSGLLAKLVDAQPAVARMQVVLGHWWQTPRRSTPLHWLCAEPDVSPEAIEHLVAAAETAAAHTSGADSSGGSAAAVVEELTGCAPLHVLCANQSCTDAALRSLVRAAPEMADVCDRNGQRPQNLLGHSSMTPERLAILVQAAPSCAATGRMPLPPHEESEWTERPPPNVAAAAVAAAADEAEGKGRRGRCCHRHRA